MKRFISIALVLMMVVALTVTAASAKESPIPKDYYRIEVGSEGKGTATKSTDRIKMGSDDDVTFNAYEAGGFFTKWIVDGKYDVISGDEYDPVFVIRPRSDVKAIAHFSVEKDYLNAFVTADPENLGDVSVSPSRIKKNSDGTMTFTATGKNGGVFAKWEIIGDYEIVSGDLNSAVLVIRPYTDIYATAKFTKNGEPLPDDDSKKDDSTSPKTGYPLFIVFGLMGLALCAGVVATKKIKG